MGLTLRFRVFERDDFKCQYCGRSRDDGVTLEVDHVIPRSKGGANVIDNLVTACFDCNRGKRDMILSGVKKAGMSYGGASKAISDACARAAKSQAEAKIAAAYKAAVYVLIVEITGEDAVDKSTVTILGGYCATHGFDMVARWIAIASERVGRRDTKIGRYVTGCKKQYDEHRFDAPPDSTRWSSNIATIGASLLYALNRIKASEGRQ